jgi:uncharacterized protein
MRRHCQLRLALLGLAFGFVLVSVGFSDPAEVRRMFLVQELRLHLTFGLAVVTLGVALRALGRGGMPGGARLHAWTVPGSLLFGAGWALCGGCPTSALAQLGEGRWAVVEALAGVLGGAFLGRKLQGWLAVDSGSC